eukprot:1310756-Rhodomonas_salina.2
MFGSLPLRPYPQRGKSAPTPSESAGLSSFVQSFWRNRALAKLTWQQKMPLSSVIHDLQQISSLRSPSGRSKGACITTHRSVWAGKLRYLPSHGVRAARC